MKGFIKDFSEFVIQSIKDSGKFLIDFISETVMQSIKIIVKALIGLFVLLLLFHLVMFIIDPYSAEKEACMYDSGGIWDDSEKRCRKDCLWWGEKYGCIKMSEQQMKLYNQYLDNDQQVPPSLKKEICLNNQKAWNIDEEDCYFDFSEKDCAELSGSWQYPDICSDKK